MALKSSPPASSRPRAELENKDEIIVRIREEGKYAPLEKLGVGFQYGYVPVFIRFERS